MGHEELRSAETIEKSTTKEARILEALALPLEEGFKSKIEALYSELEKLTADADASKKELGISEEDARLTLPYEIQWKVSAIEDELASLEKDHSELIAKTKDLVPYSNIYNAKAWDDYAKEARETIKKMQNKYGWG